MDNKKEAYLEQAMELLRELTDIGFCIEDTPPMYQKAAKLVQKYEQGIKTEERIQNIKKAICRIEEARLFLENALGDIDVSYIFYSDDWAYNCYSAGVLDGLCDTLDCIAERMQDEKELNDKKI